MSPFPDHTLREATFLRGTLAQPLLFREALAALYDVVVSDFKYRPRDRSPFFAWLEEQDRQFLANLASWPEDEGAPEGTSDDRLQVLNHKRDERAARSTRRASSTSITSTRAATSYNCCSIRSSRFIRTGLLRAFSRDETPTPGWRRSSTF